jgi:Do/DeqQ family serine protease
VIEGASEVKVALADKREFDAEIVLKDEHSDLAVLRLKGATERFPALEFGNSDDLQVGDVVLAIGDPFGVGQTVTHGIVSALARTQVGISDYQFFIQTDAAINPGNSGGALVDLNGKLVGINTAIYSRSGGSQGIGFAIPANMVRVVVASAKGGSAAVKRPWLGAKLQEVTPEIAESLGLKRPSGALVASVASGGPAARAGIKTGDVIVSIDGTTVDDPNAFDYRFATKPLGGNAQVGCPRQGTRNDRRRSPAKRPRHAARGDRDPRALAVPRRHRRQSCRRRSPTSCGSIRRADGVVITEVADGSAAQSIGFQKGDIVIIVNNQKIEKSADLDRVTAPAAGNGASPSMRGGQQISVMFSG